MIAEPIASPLRVISCPFAFRSHRELRDRRDRKRVDDAQQQSRDHGVEAGGEDDVFS